MVEGQMAIAIFKAVLNSFDDLSLERDTRIQIYEKITNALITEGQKVLNAQVSYMIQTQERQRDPEFLKTLDEADIKSEAFEKIKNFNVEVYKTTMQKDLDVYSSALSMIKDEKVKTLY